MVSRKVSTWSVQTGQSSTCACTSVPRSSPNAISARSSASGCGTIHLPTLAQLDEGAPDMTLDRAHRQAGGRGDLRMAQLTVEREQNHPSLLLGEQVELVAHDDPVDDPVGGGGLALRRG